MAKTPKPTECLACDGEPEYVIRLHSDCRTWSGSWWLCEGCINFMHDEGKIEPTWKVYRLPPKSVRQSRVAVSKPAAVNGVSPQRIVAERDSLASGATGTGVRKKGMHR